MTSTDAPTLSTVPTDRCWSYLHTSGVPPIRCTVQPDHHDGRCVYPRPTRSGRALSPTATGGTTTMSTDTTEAVTLTNLIAQLRGLDQRILDAGAVLVDSRAAYATMNALAGGLGMWNDLRGDGLLVIAAAMKARDALWIERDKVTRQMQPLIDLSAPRTPAVPKVTDLPNGGHTLRGAGPVHRGDCPACVAQQPTYAVDPRTEGYWQS